MLKSQDEEVLTLWIQHPLVRSSMKTIWQVQKRKIHQVQKREFIKAKKKGNPSRRDKILRKHQIVRNKKEKAIKLEKTSTKKKKKKRKKEVNARIFIKLWENSNLLKKCVQSSQEKWKCIRKDKRVPCTIIQERWKSVKLKKM